jgi:DNA-binding NtrC family response regulator
VLIRALFLNNLIAAQSFAERVFSLSPAVAFAPGALRLLERYQWPGNIRELENAVVHAAAMCDGTIRVKDLPDRVRSHSPSLNGNLPRADAPARPENWVPLSTVEGEYVGRVLQHTGGNKQAAARVLGVDRKTLDRMIKRHGISKPQKSS